MVWKDNTFDVLRLGSFPLLFIFTGAKRRLCTAYHAKLSYKKLKFFGAQTK